MKRLRKLITALSQDDIIVIRASFYRSSDKVALLFERLQQNVSNAEIQGELQLSGNAFTTLGTRLKEKIQNHLIDLSDSPRADVLNKLLKIDDILFNEDPTIALSTLKKLESELKKYDLSKELTVVYKHLKKLHLNKPDYFPYSQLYNRHVAYSLAIDKAEELLGKYFKEFGIYHVMGDLEKLLTLRALFDEMRNVCMLYQSHRMKIYLSAMEVMHRLYADTSDFKSNSSIPIEDIFSDAERIFKQYPEDNIYNHLALHFKFLRLEYYFRHQVYDKAFQLLDELRPLIPTAIVHFENYGFLVNILNHLLYQNLNATGNKKLIELDKALNTEYLSDASKVVVYVFQAITAFYERNYTEASRWLFLLGNQVSFKQFSQLFIEIKCLTAFIKFYQGDRTLLRQNLTAAQRMIRSSKTITEDHLHAFVKMLSVLNSNSDTYRRAKLQRQIALINENRPKGYHPVLFLKLDSEELLDQLSRL